MRESAVTEKMRIVLAICTCRRPQMLLDCLNSIKDGSSPPDNTQIELVIVDNDGSESAKNVVEQFCQSSPYETQYICEARAGIPFARNKAVEAALKLDAQAMIFIDDDEIVRHDWLNLLIARYISRQTGSISVIQGPVFPKFQLVPPPELPIDLFSSPGLGWRNKKKLKTAATNNVIFNLALCKKGGLRFDERMRFSGSSDTVFFSNAYAQGFIIEWFTDAVVDEVIPPSRMSMEWLRQRYYRYGISNVYGSLLRVGYLRTLRIYGKHFFSRLKTAIWSISLWDKQKMNRAQILFFQAGGVLMGLLGFRYNEYLPPEE